jgi:predicted nucleic-acid-binding protein
MVTVDTNIVVRLLTQDDASQFQKSAHIFRSEEFFIPDTVILETEWVLRFAYQFKPTEICRALRTLFGLPNVHLANANLVAQVLKWHEDNNLDFADAFHLACSQTFSTLYTFDNKFKKQAVGLTRCEVKSPEAD